MTEISASVRSFVAECVDSVSLLDVLLLLHGAPDRAWTAGEVGRALTTSERFADGRLHDLCRHRLAAHDAGAYRYAGGDRARAVDELADCYARRRHTVIALICRANGLP